MFTPEKQLKEIIGYQNLPPASSILKPGFHFDPSHYPEMNKLKLVRQSISLIDEHTVMQHLVFEGGEKSLFFYFLVNAASCQEAREKALTFASSITSMMPSSFAAGPSGIGEFSIIPKGATDNSIAMIHFVRNNIVVSITVNEGAFNVVELAKKIDGQIQKQENFNAMSLKTVSPAVKTIDLSDDKILKNDVFTLSIEAENKNGVEYLNYIFQYDEGRLSLESQSEGKAKFLALAPGETKIRFAVVDTVSLLATTGAVGINITGK